MPEPIAKGSPPGVTPAIGAAAFAGPVSDDPLLLADTGIRLRDERAYAAAAAVFQDLIENYPHLVYGWQEMAVLRAQLGEPEEALRLFAKAAQVDPADLQTRKHLVLHQLRLGLIDEARMSLRSHSSGQADRSSDLALLQELVDFIGEYPRSRALELAARFEDSEQYLAPALVEQRILAAIEARGALSLIRLGDGEGAWFSISDADEARFHRIYETNRREILAVWFGTDSAYTLPSFLATRKRLIDAANHADIIGLPYSGRITHEYNVCSTRGIASNINILRWFDAPRDDAGLRRYCSQDIHMDLHWRKFFPKLLSLPIDFGIVSCHPEIGYRLARAFGTRVVRMFIVPEEMGFSKIDENLPAITGISGIAEPHFPFVYNRTIAKLEREAPQARVWLVAAGYLGKIYCDVVRNAGAIALDVGSIVDGWSGAVTRPYLRAIENFRV